MARLVVVAPPPWAGLVAALRAAGHLVEQPTGWADQLADEEVGWPIAVAELRDALVAAGTDPELLALVDGTRHRALRAWGVWQQCHAALPRGQPGAIVTTCTADAYGRAAVQAARERGVPLIHLQHACNALRPEDAEWAREAPGDVVLVPGERDRQWWQRANPAANVTITGHPLWDGYATLTRDTTPRERPVILWACESGANAWQSPAIWQSREVPKRAWRAFLEAMRRVERPCQVIFKARQGEAPEVIQRWGREAVEALRESGHELVMSIEPPPEVLPRCDVVCVQQSNLGVEALHLGIPVISIERDGGELFEPEGGVALVQPGPCLTMDLWGAIDEALRFPWAESHRAALREEATSYNRGATDGRSLARVVEAITAVVETREAKEPAHA